MKKTRVVWDDLDSLIHTFYSFLKFGRLIEVSWPVDLITSLKYHILALKWQISSQWFTLPRNLGLTVIVNKNYKCVCNKCQMSVPDNFKILLVIKLAHYQLLIIFCFPSSSQGKFHILFSIVKMKMSTSEFWLHFLLLSLGKSYPNYLPYPFFNLRLLHNIMEPWETVTLAMFRTFSGPRLSHRTSLVKC